MAGLPWLHLLPRLTPVVPAPVTSTLPSAESLQASARPDGLGRFGRYGGQYVPETLMPALAELEQAAAKAWQDPTFTERLKELLRTYVGLSLIHI